MIALEGHDCLLQVLVVDIRSHRGALITRIDSRKTVPQPENAGAARTRAQRRRHAGGRMPQQRVLAEPECEYLADGVRDGLAAERQ